MQPGDPGSEENPFAAVLVLKDPSDWYRDLQLILDVVLTRERSPLIHKHLSHQWQSLYCRSLQLIADAVLDVSRPLIRAA